MADTISLVVLGTSIWVLIDALHIGVRKGCIAGVSGDFNMGPVGWFFSCLLLWIFYFPAYLMVRSEYKRTTAIGGEPTRK